MTSKKALMAMAAARRAAVRELNRWDGIETGADFRCAIPTMAERIALYVIRAHQAAMKGKP